LRIAEVTFGVEETNSLYNTIKNYAYIEHIGLAHDAKPEQIKEAFDKLGACDIAIVQLNKTGSKPENNYGVSPQTLRLMDTIASLKPSVLLMVTNPYVLNRINFLPKFKAVLMGYEYMPSLLKASANVILGVNQPIGKLPVTTDPYRSGAGLGLELPKAKSIDLSKERFYERKFGTVDSLALAGIAEGAYPGCQIVAMKNGQVIYQKSFGNYTYNHDSKPVDNGTIYDLASVTKIASSSLALMKLKSDSLFDYKKTLGDYLPGLAGSNKEKLVIEDVLAHQAGLQAWIPFYQKTIEKNGKYKPGFYSGKASEEYPIQVAKDLYAVKGFNDTIYNNIVSSKLGPQGKYLYSDLGYYFMQQIIEQQTHAHLDTYVRDLYAKVGIGLTYRPLNYFSKIQIAPTENDLKFRKQLVQGYVHDPGAALLGGVAGHAGLFGNALDLAKLMQLYMNKGELNGVRLLDSNVVKDFTSCHFCPSNRRGLCFEKPEMDPKKESPVTSQSSAESFGHSGFTGTFAWADPKNQLVVVFLSNRVYPDAEDNKLTKLGIRGKIHKAFYDATKEQ
jgi:CubicO group peptidase (beta-lactamase class C family)